jgi:YbgC/YbaW family acyl-CoA thioester hydrolase
MVAPVTLHERGDDSLVGRREKEIPHLGNGNPPNIVMVMKADVAAEQDSPDGDQSNDLSAAVIVHGLGDDIAGLYANVHFLMKLARRALAGGLAGLDLPAGKFPVSAEGYLGLPARDKDMPLAILDYCRGDVNHAHEYIPLRAGLSKKRELTTIGSMKHIAKLTVRSYELDSYNHVNNAVYLQYLEYARMEYLRAIGFDYDALFEAGYYLYVTHVDIHYRSSARLFDELTVEVMPLKIGKVSGTFSQTIRNQRGETCAEADVSWGCVDKSGKPSKIPDGFLVPGLDPATN